MLGRDGRPDQPRPCPFCGGKFMSMESVEGYGPHGEVHRHYSALCRKCWAMGPRVAVNHLSLEDAERRAWEAWDARKR